MSTMRVIAQRAHRSANIATAHRKVHEAARLLKLDSTPADLANASDLLHEAAESLAAARKIAIANELHEART